VLHRSRAKKAQGWRCRKGGLLRYERGCCTNQARRRRRERNFQGKVDCRHLELAATDCSHGNVAIFVVRIGFLAAESQSTPRPSRYSVSRYAVRDLSKTSSSFRVFNKD
jgi:hypothetical protein